MAVNGKNIAIIFFCLATLGFFKPLVVPPRMLNYLYYIVFFISLVYIITRYISRNDSPYKSRFTFPVLLIILSIVLSYIPAYFIWGQGFRLSFLVTIYILSYILYFLLLDLDIAVQDIEKMIIIFGVTYLIVYVISFITFPDVVFRIKYFGNDRGYQRIIPKGLGFLFLLSFLSISRYLEQHKPRWLVLFAFTLLGIIMTLTRALIAVSFIMLALFLLRKSSLLKKVVVIVLIGIFVYMISQTPLYKNLTQKTQEQTEEWENDIRMRAAHFYLHEFSPHFITKIVGNGMADGHSPYGFYVVYQLEQVYGLYLSDIGYLGIYVWFGIFFILAIFIFIFRVITLRINIEYLYLKYFFYFVFFVSVINGVWVYPDYILPIVLSAYILSKKDQKEGELLLS